MGNGLISFRIPVRISLFGVFGLRTFPKVLLPKLECMLVSVLKDVKVPVVRASFIAVYYMHGYLQL